MKLEARMARRNRNPHCIDMAELRRQKTLPQTQEIVEEVEVIPQRISTVNHSKGYQDIVYKNGLVSVVLTHWNRLELLKRAITSIRANTEMPIELVIVDNGSNLQVQIELHKYLQELNGFECIKLLTVINEINCSSALNMGINASRGQHLVIGNDDIEVKSKEWAERFIIHAERNIYSGIIGVCSDNSYQPQNVPAGYDTEKHIGEVQSCDQISHIFAYIPRSALSTVGYLDENLGSYSGADSDFAIRVQAHGLKAIFAKDILVYHLIHQTKPKYAEMYPHMKKKYGVAMITAKNSSTCIEIAKRIYNKRPKEINIVSNETKTDAVGIWHYRGTLIEKTIASLVKYTPEEIPIYILDQSAPEMLSEKEHLHAIAEPYHSRIKIAKCFVSRKREDAPLSILKFLQDHPEVQHLFKIDDDFIVCNDAYSALKKAYDSQPDTLQSFLLCPINIWGLNIFKERLQEFAWLTPELLNPETMYNALRKDTNAVLKIWQGTTPPSRVMPLLQTGERYQFIPKFNQQFSIGHCFAHREDFIAVGGIWDEPNWQKLAHQSGRPRVVDTYSLIYHLAWYPFINYALKTIVPELINKTEF